MTRARHEQTPIPGGLVHVVSCHARSLWFSLSLCRKFRFHLTFPSWHIAPNRHSEFSALSIAAPLRIRAWVGYNPINNDISGVALNLLSPASIEGIGIYMDADRLEHFRKILTEQLHRHTEQVRGNQQAALDMIADDGVKDSVDMSLQDVNQELQLRLGERESQMVADIDEALRRIDEGTFGTCERCGTLIPDARLQALPTARFDAACQSELETRQGLGEDIPTL